MRPTSAARTKFTDASRRLGAGTYVGMTGSSITSRVRYSRDAMADKPVRHRLLGGFVRRIAEGGDADAFALRGGMLVRHWFPESRRPARDVDLVCRLPYDVRAMRALFARTLAREVGDGVVFEADRFRVDKIQTATPHP